jgi:N-carbamoyl-L-amino-acid hydrolase
MSNCISNKARLERAGVPLGVVTGIQSVRWYRVVCTGMAAHAGTTPMDERSDAMAAAVGQAPTWPTIVPPL